MGAFRLMKTAYIVAKRDGLLSFVKHSLIYVAYEIHARWCDWALGVQTSRHMTRAELGFDEKSDNFKYSPTDYRSFQQIMKHCVNVKGGRDVFIDLGSGMGRVVIMAAMFPFARVIGVELSPELSEISKVNVARVQHRFACKEVQIIQADATQFEIPSDASYVYFFNSFTGSTLSKVLDNLYQSLLEKPRDLRILSANAPQLEEEASRRPWMVKLQKFSSLTRFPYIVYDCRPVNAQSPADCAVGAGASTPS